MVLHGRDFGDSPFRGKASRTLGTRTVACCLGPAFGVALIRERGLRQRWEEERGRGEVGADETHRACVVVEEGEPS